MRINIYNLPGRDELGTVSVWRDQVEKVKNGFPLADFSDLWIDIYHKDHPDAGRDGKPYSGLYTHNNRRIRIFVSPETLDYEMDVLAHEIGHFYGHMIGFGYSDTHISVKLTEKFHALLPKSDKISEEFAQQFAFISGAHSTKYTGSDELKTLMQLAWPVKKHLSNKIFERLTAGKRSVVWLEYEIKQFLFWPQLVKNGWFGFNSAGVLQKYVKNKWTDV